MTRHSSKPNKSRNVNPVRGRTGNVTIHKWKIYYIKIKVIALIINFRWNKSVWNRNPSFKPRLMKSRLEGRTLPKMTTSSCATLVPDNKQTLVRPGCERKTSHYDPAGWGVVGRRISFRKLSLLDLGSLEPRHEKTCLLCNILTWHACGMRWTYVILGGTFVHT